MLNYLQTQNINENGRKKYAKLLLHKLTRQQNISTRHNTLHEASVKASFLSSKKYWKIFEAVFRRRVFKEMYVKCYSNIYSITMCIVISYFR